VIVVQTPLRISFVGGGTDFPQYFTEEGGCVLTTAIDRYIFVIIKERFDDMIRIGYTKTELVRDIDELEHELVREALRKTGVTRRIEISTMGDIPSSGSGMGSSSTLTVGLLNGLHHFIGQPRDAETLAREACEIELQQLARPIGIQDQYIASYGGQRFLEFARDGTVTVESLQLHPAIRRCLNENLMLFYTNIARHAETILAEQVCNMPRCHEMLRQMKLLAREAKAALECGELDEFGLILHRAWQLKKQLASKVSNGPINAMYEAARKAGALGGKITGAGGGGFLLLYCRREKQDAVRSALDGYPELSFRFERDGSKVIFSFRRCD
jgi:D-glycero-alpha-D-manno-heptose-7-phosphate kinase